MPRERELTLAHAQRCSILIMEQSFSPLAVEMVLGKHCNFSIYLAKGTSVQSGACAEVQIPDYGTVLWSLGSRISSRNTAVSATILPRVREISLAHAQRCSFLIMEQSCGARSVEFIPVKHCDFSTYLAKRARAHFGACVVVQFSDYRTVLWAPGSRNCSRKAGKHCDFSTYLTMRARAQFGACAEVHFPDYGTVLWAPGSRNYSRKALRFQHHSCQESESSVRRMRRGAVS
jgi:hypothetical protein